MHLPIKSTFYHVLTSIYGKFLLIKSVYAGNFKNLKNRGED